MDEKIEEMIDLQRKHCESQRIGDCIDKDCNGCSARAFYNAGYRKESDTAKEILTAIKEDKSGYWDSCDCGKEELHW